MKVENRIKYSPIEQRLILDEYLLSLRSTRGEIPVQNRAEILLEQLAEKDPELYEFILAKGKKNPLVTVGDLMLNHDERIVLKFGHKVKLNPREYSVVVPLFEHAGLTLPYNYLLNRAWGENQPQNLDTLSQYMRRIRVKLDERNIGGSWKYFKSVYGIGYRLQNIFLPQI